jgi:pteridine reductase
MTAARKPRRVLVVGATGRLGVAIAEGLVNRGDDVVLTARDPNKLEQMSATLDRGRGRAPFVTADLTHRDAVERIVEGLRAALPV